uniref:Globin family profile domain-containing protein n=1 Tax=Meloidogyne floridensis TaxID=298350 RepID=A0A915NR45_9BILA
MPASSTMAAIKNGGPFSHFRRTQSLRFPRATTTGSPLGSNHHHPAISSPSSCGVQSANGSGSLSRKGSRNFRSKSSRHRHGSTEALSLLGRMSNSQKIALCTTWRQMRQQQGQLFSLMRKIFMELAQTEPAVKEIFCKADYVDCWEKASGGGPNPASMEEHIRMLIKFIDDLVQFVEGDSENQQIINSSSKCIGQQHAFLSRTSQLSANVWDKLGEIVMEKVCSVECVQKTREAGRAWRTLIAFWTDEIRCGFEGEVKAFSRQDFFKNIFKNPSLIDAHQQKQHKPQ